MDNPTMRIVKIDDRHVLMYYEVGVGRNSITMSASLEVSGSVARFTQSIRGHRPYPTLSYEKTDASTIADYMSQGAPLLGISWVGIQMFKLIKQALI